MAADPQSVVDWARLRRLMVFSACLTAFVSIVGLFYRSILIPILVSIFMSYLIAPLVDSFEKKFRVARVYLVTVILCLILAGIGVSMAGLVPVVYRQSLAILAQIPGAMNYISDRIDPLRQSLSESGYASLSRIDALLARFDLWSNVSGQVNAGVQKLLQTTPGVLTGLLNTMLTPILVFFILVDLPRLRRLIDKLVPRDLKNPVKDLLVKIDEMLRSVLKGQVMVAGILAIFYMFGLSLIHLESGLAIGLIAGLCRIIPYFDVVIGISLSLIVVITTGAGFAKLAMVGVVFAVVQILDGMIITPRVIGTRAGLHPIMVIASVIAFSDWMGFWGVLVAVPVVAIAKVLLESGVVVYLQSPFFRASSPTKLDQ